MLEDELLKRRFKRGSKEALSRIYQKYLDSMLTLAMGLLNDADAAQDVVQDVFVSFARSPGSFRVGGSLSGYLATSVVNRVRDRLRSKRRREARANPLPPVPSDPAGPQDLIIGAEEAQRLAEAMTELPYDQREVIVLRLNGKVKFREIAGLQGVPLSTVQARYRYGLNKLRSVLNGEVPK